MLTCIGKHFLRYSDIFHPFTIHLHIVEALIRNIIVISTILPIGGSYEKNNAPTDDHYIHAADVSTDDSTINSSCKIRR